MAITDAFLLLTAAIGHGLRRAAGDRAPIREGLDLRRDPDGPACRLALPVRVGRATLAAYRAAYDRWSARADAGLTFYLDAALAAGFDPDVIRASAQVLSPPASGTMFGDCWRSQASRTRCGEAPRRLATASAWSSWATVTLDSPIARSCLPAAAARGRRCCRAAAPEDRRGAAGTGRSVANPSLAIVWTRDVTNEIAMAMIAGTRKGVYLGSKRRPVGLASAAVCARRAPAGVWACGLPGRCQPG
jgi:hypothetical protein